MVNPTGFPSFPQPERGGQGGDDFLFKAALAAALWLPLAPLPPVGRLSRPRRSGFFSFCFFFFFLYVDCWRGLYVAETETGKAGGK